MQCSKEFVVAYNEVFRMIKAVSGTSELVRFWGLLGDLLCQRLVYLAETKGIPGLVEYWTETLTGEGADCEIVYQTNHGKPTLTLDILSCPSYKKMDEAKVDSYTNYCGHCQVMYAKALAPLGISFRCDADNTGRCFITVKKE